MSRIISGIYGGQYIGNPKHSIRPTTGKSKEYLFNVLQNCNGFQVLDLFSGTGALGIEALSRGANHVTFIDNHPRSIQLIRSNCEKLKLPDICFKIKKTDVFTYIKKNGSAKMDLILADPPYDSHVPEIFFRQCLEILNVNGVFIFEYSCRQKISFGDLTAFKEKRFGETGIWMFKKQ